MKKALIIIIAAIMVMAMSIPAFASSSTTFQEALSYKNSHRQISGPVGGIDQYLKHHPGEVNITQDEINALVSPRGLAGSIPQEAAIADADLFFRALKYRYGAYYYFGEQNFENARNAVMGALAGKASISGENFRNLLCNNLSFVRDAHFHTGRSILNPGDFYQTYYCDLHFAWDSQGYYMQEGENKWYYNNPGNANITMEYVLTDTGELVYSPIQFCVPGQHVPSTAITLTSAVGSKTVTASWKPTQPYAADGFRQPDYKQLEANGIVYISYRNCDSSYDDIHQQFINGASSARNAKLVILDLRANGGGSDEYPRRWVERFTGQSANYGGVWSGYRNALEVNEADRVAIGNEGYDKNSSSGSKLSNSIPLIVLVDNKCGSSGESAYLFAETVNNSITIGCNTAGYQLSGNVADFYLPNSGVCFSFGRNMSFTYSNDNVDGKGYKPDIWCNPKNAIPAICNMLKENGLADDATINALQASGMR